MSHPTKSDADYVLPFSRVGLGAIAEVGGKNASLGELIRPVGGGRAGARRLRAHRRRLPPAPRARPGSIAPSTTSSTGSTCATSPRSRPWRAAIRERVAAAPLPRGRGRAARRRLPHALGALRRGGDRRRRPLQRDRGGPAERLVRGTAGDLPQRARAARRSTAPSASCMASLFTDRAIVYRVQSGLPPPRRGALGRRAEDGAQRPRLGRRHLHARHRERLPRRRADHRRVGPGRDGGPGPGQPRRVLGPQADPRATASGRSSGARSATRRSSWSTRRAAASRCARCGCPADDRARRGARATTRCCSWRAGRCAIEDHYSRGPDAPRRWTSSGRRTAGAASSSSSRPGPRRSTPSGTRPTLELYRRAGEGQGAGDRARASGSGVGVGPVRVIRPSSELASLPGRRGARRADDRPRLGAGAQARRRGRHRSRAAAPATRRSSPASSASPAWSAPATATRILATGRQVTVSCAEGDDGQVYEGLVAFERDEIDPATLPVPRVPLMLNLGNPDRALSPGAAAERRASGSCASSS